MIEIQNAKMFDGSRNTVRIRSDLSRVIDARAYTLFPALIDPHVHFRVPGQEHKETWETGAAAAIAGGVTTVLDMPNNAPSCSTKARVAQKKELIEGQLRAAGIPLRYGLYLGADRYHLQEIGKAKGDVAALKIYMGSSTGDLLMDDLKSLDEAFRLAAEHDVLVAVHAEDERLIQLNLKAHAGKSDPALHSVVRSSAVAANAVAIAIELAKKRGARLYVVHTSTRSELDLIREAKREGLPVYAEASPHHLFLDTGEYGRLQTRALVNPPLRDRDDQEALWEAVADGTIDTVGTDHAPHTLEEKTRPYGSAPSGFPSIELYLPLLLTAHREGRLSLESIVSLTSARPREIFRLPPNDDVVLVDLVESRRVDDASLKTKAKWSPYAGRLLTGWPKYTILKGRVYAL